MKIAFIGGRTFYHPDGIATYMYNLATELVKMGHEPIVYQESDHNGEEWVNGFKVVHQKSFRNAALTKILLGFKSTIMGLFKEKDIQVFHYNCGAPALISSIWPRLLGRVSLMQNHGLEFNRTKYSLRKRNILRKKFYFDCKINKYLTAVSQEQTDFIREHFHKDCRTISCAVNIPQETSKSDVLERFGIIPNNYIVFMGRLVQDKNPDYLIKGFMNSQHGDKQLVICGCAAPRSMEGLPISLLEGMSYGKVCIASDITANKEALGDSGIWVKKENAEDITYALDRLYTNFENYEWQKKVNRERCERLFSWPKIAKDYIDFLSELIKK